MTPDELLRVTFHELNQKSAAALMLVMLLTDENRAPLSPEKQSEILSFLRAEIEAIRKINDRILHEHKPFPQLATNEDS
ncbi:MAG: hypothetical protein U0559_19045 [Anaerolineae bacterium]